MLFCLFLVFFYTSYCYTTNTTWLFYFYAQQLFVSAVWYSVFGNPAALEVMIIINVLHEGQMSNMTSTSSFCGSDYGKDIFTTPSKPQVCRTLFTTYLNVIRRLFSGKQSFSCVYVTLKRSCNPLHVLIAPSSSFCRHLLAKFGTSPSKQCDAPHDYQYLQYFCFKDMCQPFPVSYL